MKQIILLMLLLMTFGCSHLSDINAPDLNSLYKDYTANAYLLKVRGMICGACRDGLDQELRKDKRILAVDIDLENEIVFIKTSEIGIDLKKFILEALRVRGLELLVIQHK